MRVSVGALLGALKAAGPGGEKAGQRKILVLSDGKDTTTTALLARRNRTPFDLDSEVASRGSSARSERLRSERTIARSQRPPA